MSSAGLATHHYASPTPGDPGYPAHAARVASGARQAQGQDLASGEGQEQVQGRGRGVAGPPAAGASDPSGSESAGQHGSRSTSAHLANGYYTFGGGRMVNAMSVARGEGICNGSGAAGGEVERLDQPGMSAGAATLTDSGAAAPAGRPCMGPGPSPAPPDVAAGLATALPGLGVPGAAAQLLL